MNLKILIILILSFVFHFSFCCLNKKEHVDTGNYIVSKKWRDTVYLNQAREMAHCLDRISESIYEKVFEMTDFWTENARKKVFENFKDYEIKIFHKNRYIDCLQILASLNAKLNLCPVEPKKYAKNFIEYYAMLEYAECLRQKKAAYADNINFELPNIGFGTKFFLDETHNK